MVNVVKRHSGTTGWGGQKFRFFVVLTILCFKTSGTFFDKTIAFPV